jgi:hydroxymethylpyrimidine pyrophosphatase-like HAD family hydrolase
MPEPLRVSTVVDEEQAEALAAALAERFRGRLGVHAIRAPNYDVTIVEAFRAGVDKAAGVRYVAQAYGIGPGAVAAVGDDVNDLELLRLAGLSAAMPHAPEAVRAAADVVVGPSVGAFVRSLAAGEVG